MCIFLLGVSQASTINKQVENPEGETISFAIIDYKIVQKLDTVKEIMLYDGSIFKSHYENKPSEGMNYLVLNVKVEVKSNENPFNMENLKANCAEQSYATIDSSFLIDHDYKPLTNAVLNAGNYKGAVVFEIPKGKKVEDVEVKYENTNIKLSDVVLTEVGGLISDTNIKAQKTINQSDIEKDILATINTNEFTFENPYIIQDPYGTAPLTGLVVFDTEQEVKVRVKVQGKDESSNVEYVVEKENKQHQIPIVGLYADSNNKVQLELLTEDGGVVASKEIQIATPSLPAQIYNFEVDVNELEKDEAHFTHVGGVNGYNVIIDVNGDIRWYYNSATSYGFTYVDDGTFYVCGQTALVTGLGRTQNFVSTIYRIDMLGKIYDELAMDAHMHHDFSYMEDGKLYITSNNQYGTGVEDAVYIVEPTTGKIDSVIDYNEILDRYRIPVESQLKETEDWLHANAVSLNTEDGGVLVSGRKIGIIKTDKNHELEWILSQHEGWNEQLKPYLLTPVDAEGNVIYDLNLAEDRELANRDFFPLQQHAVETLHDLDGNPATEEFILFDNGGKYSFTNAKLARRTSEAVIYSVNSEEKTVRRIRAFGKELGEEFFADSVSDANLLENNHMLISSGDLNRNKEFNSHIIEVDENNEIIWSAKELVLDTRLFDVEVVEIYPENYHFTLGGKTNEISINTKVSLNEIVKKYDSFPTVTLDVQDVSATQNAGHLVLSGALPSVKFNRQLGFVKLYYGDDDYDVFGYVLLDKSSISQVLSLQGDKDYNAIEIMVVDEVENIRYISEKMNLEFKKSPKIEVLEEMSSLTTMQRASFYVDNIEINDEAITMEGWAYIPKVSSETGTSYMVLKGENGSYKVQLEKFLRKDISKAFSTDNTNYDDSGFVLNKFDLNKLPPDSYTLGIMILNGDEVAYADTEYYFTVNSLVKQVSSSDTLELQAEIEKALQLTYEQGDYSLENPLVVNDPYEFSPLTAIAMFKTEQPSTIEITVKSKNGAVDIHNNFTDMKTDHVIPIYGLYAQEATDVILTATMEDKTTATKTLSVTGGALPNYFADGEVVISKDTSLMTKGLTFLGMEIRAIDETGAIRWIPSKENNGIGNFPIVLLENGNLLTATAEASPNALVSHYGMQEIDLTGKVYAQYIIGDTHHDGLQLPNGNFLVGDSEPDVSVTNETILEVERNTGNILRSWDLDAYFPVPLNEEGKRLGDELHRFDPTWFHNNAIAYSEKDNSMILSGRHQDAVIKIDLDTGELVWILSDHDSDWTEEQKSKLLTPVGDLDAFGWTYGQHNIVILPDGDIMIFDNGNARSKRTETAVAPTENYSRVVRYRIDEENKTVEQIWQYGKERGAELFAMYISGQQYLGEGHYLMNFGGIVCDKEGNAADDMGTLFGTGITKSVVIEMLNDEIIFEYHIIDENQMGGNSYRATRREAYTSQHEHEFSQGVRYGKMVYHGFAKESELPDITPITVDDSVIATDNGIYLELVNLPNVEKEKSEEKTDKLTLYFVGDKVYETQVSIRNNKFHILGGELPVGDYALYYALNDVLYNLNYNWSNSITARPMPERYQIEVNSNDSTLGTAYGAGLYYGKTPMMARAYPTEKANFVGWEVDGKIVSNEEKYTFTPVTDAELVAVFEAK